MIILLISIVLYLIEAHNHGITMPDFEVYYKSAVRLLQGENLYRIESDGFYVFKYAPASAIFFLPFTIVPFALAKYLYWVFLTLVAMAAVYIVFDLSKPGLAQRKVSKFTTYVLLLVLSMGLHLYREFILGQVNIDLFLSYILILILIQKDKPYLAGLFLAAGIMFKPWGIIFLPWLLLRKDYRIVLSFLLFTTLLFLLPVIFYGWQGLLEQNGKWLQQLILEMENKKE